eukprot:Hpha_TRINITY_DN32242_c0_g1::TRINITY_DN32242_c0_g1_i1::g.155162::m.155162
MDMLKKMHSKITGKGGPHPREDFSAPALRTSRDCLARGSVRFVVMGDVGQPGSRRVAVAKGVEKLLKEWRKEGGSAVPAFCVGTGDQVYGAVDEAAFKRMETEVLDRVNLPWVLTLGNHDVDRGGVGWVWHRERHGRQGREQKEGG